MHNDNVLYRKTLKHPAKSFAYVEIAYAFNFNQGILLQSKKIKQRTLDNPCRIPLKVSKVVKTLCQLLMSSKSNLTVLEVFW